MQTTGLIKYDPIGFDLVASCAHVITSGLCALTNPVCLRDRGEVGAWHPSESASDFYSFWSQFSAISLSFVLCCADPDLWTPRKKRLLSTAVPSQKLPKRSHNHEDPCRQRAAAAHASRATARSGEGISYAIT